MYQLDYENKISIITYGQNSQTYTVPADGMIVFVGACSHNNTTPTGSFSLTVNDVNMAQVESISALRYAHQALVNTDDVVKFNRNNYFRLESLYFIPFKWLFSNAYTHVQIMV